MNSNEKKEAPTFTSVAEEYKAQLRYFTQQLPHLDGEEFVARLDDLNRTREYLRSYGIYFGSPLPAAKGRNLPS